MTSHPSMAADASQQGRETAVSTVLPLALLTCNSILALDLYLPAVPALQRDLATGVALGQATIALYLVGLALSQLLWGELLHVVGPRRAIQAGVAGLAVCSGGCAFAASIDTLLAWRFAQGLFAGAATVIAPVIVKSTLEEKSAVRGIGLIAGIEALMPILGPVLGAQLLLHADWRGIFMALGLCSLLVLPMVSRIVPTILRPQPVSRHSGQGLLKDGRYLKLALSHALAMGALITLVASGPQLVEKTLHLDGRYFLILQGVGVTAFIVTVVAFGPLAARVGAARAVQWGAGLQLAVAVAALAALHLTDFGFIHLALFWGGFCSALALRGPSAYVDALNVAPQVLGRASAVLVLALLCLGALGTALVAPYLEGDGLRPLLVVMVAMLAISGALVRRYPPVSGAAGMALDGGTA